MKLLLTGATGFFGRNVLDVLDDHQQFEVHAITRSGITTAHPTVAWHDAEFTDRQSMADVFAEVEPTHLLNLAWVGGEHHDDRYNSPLNCQWAEASSRVFEEFQRHGGTRLVHVGSCLEYGGSPPPWDEQASTEPETAYGRGKLETTRRALDLENLSVAVGRVFFAYGPYEDRRRLVADVITSLLRGKKVALSTGRQRRDYLHATDVARALVALCQHEGEGVYNVGAAQSWRVSELATEIGHQLDRMDLLEFGARPDGADTAPDMFSVTDRLEADTGWKPEFNLVEGLADCIDWWRGRLSEER